MKLGSRTSKLFCGSLIGLCELPKPQPWTIEFPSPKPAGGRPVPSGKEPLKIVHYSDIHIDPQYLPGSNTQCNKPICCRYAVCYFLNWNTSNRLTGLTPRMMPLATRRTLLAPTAITSVIRLSA